MFYFEDDKNITVYFADGRVASWESTDPLFNVVKKKCQDADWTAITNMHTTVDEMILDKDSKIGEDFIEFQGEKIKCSSPLMELIKLLRNKGIADHSIEHIRPFLEKCINNKFINAPKELCDFLTKMETRITEDGCFLAYKKVRGNLKSVYDNTTLNLPGTYVEVDKFDTDRNRTCSYGLHFCSRGYLNSYPGDAILIVKVDPEDVVSIPTDYDYEKGRCRKYYIVGVLPHGKFFDDYSVEELLNEYNIKTAFEPVRVDDEDGESKFYADHYYEDEDYNDEDVENLKIYTTDEDEEWSPAKINAIKRKLMAMLGHEE